MVNCCLFSGKLKMFQIDHSSSIGIARDWSTVLVWFFVLEKKMYLLLSNRYHEIKRCLLLGRKVMTNLDSLLKSRDITLRTKFHIVEAMVFPVVMYGFESWTVKKTEHRRIDAFELWCWRRLLRVPWPARRSNQSILMEIRPGIFLEGMMLKLNSSTLATSWEELTHWKRLQCWLDWGQEEKGMTEDEMAGWHHVLNGHES